MIWSGCADHIQRRIVERCPHIANEFRTLSLFVFGPVAPRIANLFIDVDDIEYLRARVVDKLRQMGIAASTSTDYSDADFLVGRFRFGNGW